MIQPIVRLEIYKKQGSSATSYRYDTTPSYILTSFFGLTTTYGIQKRKDKINFKLLNHRELQNDGTYQYDHGHPESGGYSIDIKDLVKLYSYNAPLPGGVNFEDLTTEEKNVYHLMSAYVKSYNYDSTATIGTMTVESFNRTEVLLNTFMFAPYNSGQTVPNMIVDSIQKIKVYNVNDQVQAYKDYKGGFNPGVKGAYDLDGNRVYYTSVNNRKYFNTSGSGAPYTGHIKAYKKAAYKTDGSGELLDAFITANEVPYTLGTDGKYLYHFDTVGYTESYKPFLDNLEDFSTARFTGDGDAGTYIFWVDENNDLYWGPKELETYQVINENHTTSVSWEKNNDKVVNAVIMNCGTDPNNNGILALAFNGSSMGKYGAKWKYLAYTNIGEEVRKKEVQSGIYESDDSNTIYGEPNATGGRTNKIGDDGYPTNFVESSFPVEGWIVNTAGTDTNTPSAWNYVAGVSPVETKNEYKNYFRRVCKEIGKKKAQNYVDFSGEALLSGKWEIENGTSEYNVGDLIKLNIPSIGFVETDNLFLRVMAISHNFSGNNWVTILEIEEDQDLRVTI